MVAKDWMLWIGIIALAIGVAWLASYVSRVKCPKCRKRNCAEVNRKETGRQPVMFQEEEVITHVDNKHGLYGGAAKAHAQAVSQYGKPDSTTIRKYKVPGERVFYTATYKCCVCGHVFTGSIHVDKKPPTV